MQFEVTILGSGSAVPTTTRHPAAQLVRINNRCLLIDCGEGTQLKLRQHHLPIQQIEVICISHMHGDHWFGLPGLLATMQLLGRTRKLLIIGPEPLERVVRNALGESFGQVGFKTEYRITNAQLPLALVHETKNYTLQSVGLLHGLPTTGFIIRQQPRPANILKEKIEEYQLTIPQIRRAKSGQAIELPNGKVLQPADITRPAAHPKAYAYCSDTAFHPPLAAALRGVDVLFHEATFLEEFADRAVQTQHSTAAQAAEIAHKAGAGKLVLGHFSARTAQMGGYLRQAKAVFENVVIAEDGLKITLEE